MIVPFVSVIFWLGLCSSGCFANKHLSGAHHSRSLDEGGGGGGGSSYDATTAEPSMPEVCGQYGFRCVDEQSFQVCRYTNIDGETEEAAEVHECAEDLICDEDNMAYCSPRFRVADSMAGTGTVERRPCKGLMANVMVQDQSRVSRNASVMEFECKEFGLFRDQNNASMFWFCERNCADQSFRQRHMFCKHGRIFDDACKQCVRPPTPSVPPSVAKPSTAAAFKCSGRNMGKYADTVDCQKYHICLPDNQAAMGTSFNQIVLLCPEGTAYSAQREVCDATARAACDGESQDEAMDEAEDHGENELGAKDCVPGTRLKDTASENDCAGYTLCTGKRMIPMRCPEHHLYDEARRMCRPEAMVDC